MPFDRAQPFVPQSRVRYLLFRVLLGCAHGLHRAGAGCVYAAAGLLRRDELQQASVYQFRHFARSASEVDAGLSPVEQHFYSRFLRTGNRVLVAGSGAGRDLLALGHLGYEVTGLEPNEELVALARAHLARRGMSVDIRSGLIQTAELGGPYDAVIFSNGCYSFLQGRKSRVDTLARVARHLSRNGVVIVSYLPSVAPSTWAARIARLCAWVGHRDWQPETGDTFSRDLRESGLVRYHHTLDAAAFAGECAMAGLQVLADEDFEDGCRFAAAAIRA